jgi:hypothetical protein
MVHKINSPQQPPAVAVAPSSDYRYNQNGHHSLAQQPNTTNNLSCQYCRNTFTNRSQLERHLRIHLSSIDLKCNICDRLFETQDLLSQHKLTHCKIYDTMDTAVKPQSHHHHQNNHHNNNNQPIVTSNGSHPNNQMPSTAICVYCKQTIENESQFKEHFKRHNNIGIQNQAQHGANGGVTKTNSFICIVCRQTLTSNSEYNLHMKHHLRRLLSTNHQQHQQAKLHQQQQQQSGNIQNGTIDKNKLKPEVLSPSTTTNSTLSTNKLKCSKCLVKFEVWQELVEHMSKAHNIRTASSSSSPSSKSTTANSSLQNNEPDASRLSNDIIKQEPTTFSSPKTNISNVNTNSSNLNKSNCSNVATNATFMSNTFLCEICSSKFDTQSKLQSHLLLKHEFPIASNSTSGPLLTALVCPVCDESFSRADHLLQHTLVHGQAARIYKCSHCTLAFVFKSQLINHSFTHQNQFNQQTNSQNSKSQILQRPQYNNSLTKIAQQHSIKTQPNNDTNNKIPDDAANTNFDCNNVEEDDEMYPDADADYTDHQDRENNIKNLHYTNDIEEKELLPENVANDHIEEASSKDQMPNSNESIDNKTSNENEQDLIMNENTYENLNSHSKDMPMTTPNDNGDTFTNGNIQENYILNDEHMNNII